jgi:hypothetical protein
LIWSYIASVEHIKISFVLVQFYSDIIDSERIT